MTKSTFTLFCCEAIYFGEFTQFFGVSLTGLKNVVVYQTLPEAQRTQDIEFIIQIIFIAEIKQTNKQTICSCIYHLHIKLVQNLANG